MLILGPVNLTCDFGNVRLQSLLQQACLLSAQTRAELLARDSELLPLEHRQLVGKLVDDGLLESRLALHPLESGIAISELVVPSYEIGHQRHQSLAHLLRIQ